MTGTHQPATAAAEAERELARQQSRSRWRRGPRYQRIAAALRALAPAALASLGWRDRQLLGWYYGLDKTEVLDHRQIAERLQLSPHQVSQQCHRVVMQLLGSELVHGAADWGGIPAACCQTCRGVHLEPTPVIASVLSWQERERVLALQAALGAVKLCPKCEQLTPVADILAGRHTCRPRKHHRQEPRACATCGTIFLARWSTLRDGAGRYCSRACARDGQRRAAAQHWGPRWQTRVCRHCGATFQARRKDVRRGWGTYCSRSCQARARATPRDPECPHWQSVSAG